MPKIRLPVLLAAVNDGTLTVPLAARPMAVLLLVHAMLAPTGTLVKVCDSTSTPAQTVSLTGGVITGSGLMIIVYVTGLPGQPFKVGVTVMVPAIAALVVLVAVKAGMLPVPVAARPMAGLLLVQVKVAPAGTLVSVTAATAAPAHFVWLGGTVTVAKGSTVMV